MSEYIVSLPRTEGCTAKYRWHGAVLVGIFAFDTGIVVQRCARIECNIDWVQIDGALRDLLRITGPIPADVWAQYHDRWIRTADGAVHCSGNTSSTEEERLLFDEYLGYEDIDPQHTREWVMTPIGQTFEMPRDIDDPGPMRLCSYADHA